MDKEQLKSNILELINEKVEIPPYELEPLFDKAGVPFNGKRSMTIDKDKKQVVIYHCSTEFGEIIQELCKDNKIKIVIKKTYLMRYLIDGKVPPLPLSLGDKAKVPSWVPVVFKIKEKDDE
ncbi:hypothetical protein A9N02_12840 [Staphylococcus sp. AOAB]|uniref:hypothetical protein n=1 Tax=Staphylococcus pasteuri TaxID=45972 RepID=UPI00086B5268|nr:hypothetical protein A9N02_12840 [Staphylococcus sp. AOAB]